MARKNYVKWIIGHLLNSTIGHRRSSLLSQAAGRVSERAIRRLSDRDPWKGNFKVLGIVNGNKRLRYSLKCEIEFDPALRFNMKIHLPKEALEKGKLEFNIFLKGKPSSMLRRKVKNGEYDQEVRFFPEWCPEFDILDAGFNPILLSKPLVSDGPDFDITRLTGRGVKTVYKREVKGLLLIPEGNAAMSLEITWSNLLAPKHFLAKSSSTAFGWAVQEVGNPGILPVPLSFGWDPD